MIGIVLASLLAIQQARADLDASPGLAVGQPGLPVEFDCGDGKPDRKANECKCPADQRPARNKNGVAICEPVPSQPPQQPPQQSPQLSSAPASLRPPELIAPRNGAKGVDHQTELVIAVPAGASAVEVEICADFMCGEPRVIRAPAPGGRASFKLPAQAGPRLRYWHARGVRGEQVDSQWSAVWRFTTAATPCELDPAGVRALLDAGQIEAVLALPHRCTKPAEILDICRLIDPAGASEGVEMRCSVGIANHETKRLVDARNAPAAVEIVDGFDDRYPGDRAQLAWSRAYLDAKQSPRFCARARAWVSVAEQARIEDRPAVADEIARRCPARDTYQLAQYQLRVSGSRMRSGLGGAVGCFNDLTRNVRLGAGIVMLQASADGSDALAGSVYGGEVRAQLGLRERPRYSVRLDMGVLVAGGRVAGPQAMQRVFATELFAGVTARRRFGWIGVGLRGGLRGGLLLDVGGRAGLEGADWVHGALGVDVGILIDGVFSLRGR